MEQGFERRFADAVLASSPAVPDGLVAWHGTGPELRFDIYRNNVATGLAKALASRFPAAERIVGAAFFAAMARLYALAHPPRSPVLLGYGDTFPDFVEAFEPAAAVPYLADVLRLEAARGEAYHAADIAPMDGAELSRLDPEEFAAARAVLHPSTRLVRSPHPVVTIWAMNAEERDVAPIEAWTGENALVVRPHLAVLVHPIPDGDAVFLGELVAGATFGAAFEAASRIADFDLTASLVRLVGAGAFAGLDTDQS